MVGMRWFEGGIIEAVGTSKARNAVFVVFVEGKDDASRNTAETVNSDAISSTLESEDFVAIKLESDSEAYRQFAQIYQLVPVPSLFFIGGNGVPLEVVAGEVSVPELKRRITLVLEKSGKAVPQAEETEASTSAPVTSAPEQVETETMLVPAKEEEVVETAAAAPSMTEENTSAAEGAPTTPNKEERIDRAKELIEQKRKEKQEEEEETQRQKELERRKMGQDVQKLRRWQQDQELKQLKEERQREKAEEAAARERILKQIAQDRAERASRYSQEQDAAKKQADEELKKRSEQQAKETAAKSDIARIQFRLPDGSTHSHNFEATAMLSELRAYAATQLQFPFREFAMSTTFPRREFTAEDCGRTVRDLQLVPTAVILILPASSANVVSSSQGQSWALSRMVWSLLTPLFSVLNYLRNLVFGGGAGNPGPNRGTHQSTESESVRTQHSSTGAKKRTPHTETTAVRRQGNIHRLTNRHDSSDDENNTWNGNSTQQM